MSRHCFISVVEVGKCPNYTQLSRPRFSKMARLLAVDDVSVSLRNSLLRHLTSLDEAVILPQASQSQDSAAFKNVCFRLSSTQTIDPNLIPIALFNGLSIAKISSQEDVNVIEKALEDSSSRTALIRRLAEAIPSEMSDDSTTVGCKLECGEDERDLEPDKWTAGFDSPSAFVGVFSAENSRPPEVGLVGQSRVFREFFLVCKAGGGLAASTFHSRLRAELNKGKTLEQSLCEDGVPGAAALRRCASAGQRNRGRIMATAAEALGLNLVSTVGDQIGRNKAKVVVADVDVVVNSLRKLETTKTSTYQLACCTDLAISKGCAWLSSAADGLTLLLSSSGDTKVSVNNEMFNCLPFYTTRTTSSRELANSVLKAHQGSNNGHVDKHWIGKRFSWKNAEVSGASASNLEPFCFYGSHSEEHFSSTFSRELGISTLKPIKLRPELVCVAGIDTGKLRGIARAL